MKGVAAALEHVSKSFGRTHALSDFTAELRFGEIVGLLGPNGAGKSTALRLLAGLARPSRGKVTVFGQPMPQRRGAVLRRVGALIEGPAFYEHLSARTNLSLLATYYGDVPRARLGEVLDRVELSGRADDPVGTYSVGMKARLGLAAALLPAPRLLLLDEPMASLDPEAVRLVARLLQREAKRHGAAVVVSSHLLYEVSRLCDRVLIIQGGRLRGEGPVDLAAEGWIELDVSDVAQVEAWLAQRPGILEVRRQDEGLCLHAPGLARGELVTELVRAGFRVDRIAPHQPSLEEYYFRRVGGAADDPSLVG